MKYVDTDNMIADILTKALPLNKFSWCRTQMNVGPSPGGKEHMFTEV